MGRCLSINGHVQFGFVLLQGTKNQNQIAKGGSILVPSLPEAFELVGWEGASSTASSCPSSVAAAADGSCDYCGDWLVTKR